MGRNRAFTLIELIVVIAIVGILSSIVHASLQLQQARRKGECMRTTSQPECTLSEQNSTQINRW